MRDPAMAANLAEAKKSLQTYHDNIVAELPKLAGADVATANSAMRAGRDGFMKADGIISTAIELVGSEPPRSRPSSRAAIRASSTSRWR
jgi:hypothetical protein